MYAKALLQGGEWSLENKFLHENSTNLEVYQNLGLAKYIQNSSRFVVPAINTQTPFLLQEFANTTPHERLTFDYLWSEQKQKFAVIVGFTRKCMGPPHCVHGERTYFFILPTLRPGI